MEANTNSPFAQTPPELRSLLGEVRRMEPIFHTLAFGTSIADFESRMAKDYWEVGASGERYAREAILRAFKDKPTTLASDLGWTTSDHALRALGADTYLLTYVLQQGSRLTRRATIWQQQGSTWRILFHQGTVVSAEQHTSSV